MVDKVEDLVVPSASELGIGITPSKESGRTPEKSKKKERAKSQLAPRFGFSAEELDAEISDAEMARINAAVEKKQSANGSNLLEQATSNPDLNELMKKTAEFFLREIRFYLALREYRSKLNEEFISVFSEDEQVFFRNMRNTLDQYIAVQGVYVQKLLLLLDYREINIQANVNNFIDDILALPVEETDSQARASRSNVVDLTLDEEPSWIEQLGQELSHSFEHVGQQLSKLAKSLVAIPEIAVQPSHSATIDKRLFNFGKRITEDNRVPIYLADRLKESKMLAEKIEDKMSSILPVLYDGIQDAGDLPIRIARYGEYYKNLSRYYQQSSLLAHVERRAQVLNAGSESIIPGGYGDDLDGYIGTPILPRRVLMLKELAENIHSEWKNPSWGSLSHYVAEIRSLATKNTLQINESKRRYVLALKLSLPRGDIEKAEKGVFYIDEAKREYIVRNLSGRICKRKLPESLDLTNLPERLDDEALVKAILTFSSSKGDIEYDNVAIKSPKSVSRLSMMMEKVKQSFRKSRKTEDFRADVSFDQFMQVVEQQVKLFQNLAAETTYQDDPRVRGWELRNPELPSDINETTTQKIAAKELYHNNALVCDFAPQNEGLGTGVTVYNHTNDNIDLVVRLMIETLAQEGKKEVCISMVIDSPEAEELALRYASTILRQGAIPILLGENGEELTVEETKDKFRTMLGSTNNLSAKHRVLLERYELEVERLEKAKEEDQKFLIEFEKFISKPILTSKSKMQDPRDAKKKLSKEEIFLRLAEIALTNHNMTTKEFVNDIVDYMARISLSPFVSKIEVKERLVERLPTLLATNPNQSPEMLIEKILAEAAKEFSLAAQIFIGNKEDTLGQQRQKEQDDNFLKEFNHALSQLRSSVTYQPLVMKDTNGNRLDEQEILEKLVEVALIKKNMDKVVFVDKIIDLALISSSNAAGGFSLSEDRDILHNILLKRCEFFLGFRTNTIEKFTSELIEIARVYCAERQGVIIPVVSDPVINVAVDEVPLNREALSTTLSGFNQRVAMLFDKKSEIKTDRRFERALGAYALFHEAIKQKRFDLARSLMSDVAFLIEDAELMLKADEAQHSVKERTYVREIYNSLLQKASAELELDLDRQSAVASTESQESLESFARNILVRDLQGQQLIEELLKEPAETTSPDEALERFLRESEPKEPSSSSQNVELTDEDRDYLAYLDDLTFMEAFDSLLQKATLAVGNHTVSMQDPNTGEDLNELQILVRLAKIALVDKTMPEEAFLERIITFAFVSPKLASNVPLTPQKTEELKKELRSKFQGKEIDPEHIDELVSKLVKIARHEYSKGHTADEIIGQHRDLYASAKATTVPSHHDDDGEGEARAPTMGTY